MLLHQANQHLLRLLLENQLVNGFFLPLDLLNPRYGNFIPHPRAQTIAICKGWAKLRLQGTEFFRSRESVKALVLASWWWYRMRWWGRLEHIVGIEKAHIGELRYAYTSVNDDTFFQLMRPVSQTPESGEVCGVSHAHPPRRSARKLDLCSQSTPVFHTSTPSICGPSLPDW